MRVILKERVFRKRVPSLTCNCSNPFKVLWPRSKNRRRPKKWLFSDFSFLLHIYTSRRNFLLPSKFHIFSRSEKSWGDKEYENFRLKWHRRPKKWLFFGFFFSLAHLNIEAQLFCFYQNFISSAVQRNHGGTREKALHQQRTNNDERRTTWTIIIPRQDSQNPRANKAGDLFEGRVFKYTTGTKVIGEKDIRIDPRGFIRGGGVNKYFQLYPGGLFEGGLFEGGSVRIFRV